MPRTTRSFTQQARALTPNRDTPGTHNGDSRETSEHHRSVIDALRELRRDEGASDPGAIARVARLAEEANRARFAASIRSMGTSLPFRKDDRPRERRIADVLRLAHLAAQNRGRRAPRSRPGEAPVPWPVPWPVPFPPIPTAADCERGWSSIIRDGDEQHGIPSLLAEKPALASLPPDQNGGYSGTSARASAFGGSITIGAVIGEFCDIEWTPPNQRIQMGAYEGAAISTSVSNVYDLGQPLSARAPDALMATAAVLRTQALPYMIAGDPAGPGGGFIWCYATTSLDLYVGSAPTRQGSLPHAFDQACLWNRMGSPFFDNVADNGVKGNWDTKIDVFDDGDFSNPVLRASLGGTGVPDRALLVTVSVNVCCLRYPGDTGFVGALFQDPMRDPLVVTPLTTWEADEGVYPQTAPIQVQHVSLCGI